MTHYTSENTRLFLKYGLPIVAILVLVFGIYGFLVEDSMTINGELGSLDLYGLLIFVAFSLALLLPWLIIKDRLVYVEMGNAGLEVHVGEEVEKLEWQQVESIKKIIMVLPPMYRLDIKGEDDYYLFIPRPRFITIGVFNWDLSAMGKFIEQKKRQKHF